MLSAAAKMIALRLECRAVDPQRRPVSCLLSTRVEIVRARPIKVWMRQFAYPGGRGGFAGFSALLSVLAATSIAWAAEAPAEPPLPPPRPVEAEPAGPKPPNPSDTSSSAPTSSKEAPREAKEPDNCVERLRSAGFVVEPAETPRTGNELCRIEAPVRLLSIPVISRPETRIVLKEQPTLACAFAESLGHWLGDLVAPMLAGHLGSDLRAVHTGPGFECRNRNRAASGKLSAHAEGMAIDISHFELADGSKLGIKPDGEERREAAIAALRKAACGWFTTILGPGSDPSYANHLHVDLQKHGSSDRYRICD
ncbi:extensin-like domain-containing protein [Microvirga sp. 2TAF3]|uniref:extensin-like domain-containing protein n=1 Tax=Microvirga sp. 2TAF3 TaxID=3233014 RepID=UPI003F9DB279